MPTYSVFATDTRTTPGSPPDAAAPHPLDGTPAKGNGFKSVALIFPLVTAETALWCAYKGKTEAALGWSARTLLLTYIVTCWRNLIKAGVVSSPF